MKAATHQHLCSAIKGSMPKYRVMLNTRNEWDVWIPDFLGGNDQSFVWRIKFCPFCGVELGEDATGVKELK